MATVPAKPAKPAAKADADYAAPAPRAMVFNSTPTPTNTRMICSRSNKTGRRRDGRYHAPDGSPVDPQSYDQTIGAPTWP